MPHPMILTPFAVIYVLSILVLLYRYITVELRRRPGNRVWNNLTDTDDWYVEVFFIAFFTLCPGLNTIAAVMAMWSILEEKELL